MVNKPLMTRMMNGQEVEVPIEEVWDSICKIMRLSWLVTMPNEPQHLLARLSFMHERLNDLQGVSFHYKRHPYSSNLGEEIIRLPKEI